MIRQERERLQENPDEDVKKWSARLAQADRMRAVYQEMAAKGLMTFEELSGRLKELQHMRETAEREMEVMQARRKRIEELERDRDDLLSYYACTVPRR